MAGDWIKMSTGLRRHPKVVRMASALKADRLRVVGGLHAVWSIFDEQSPDGVLEGYTAAIMDEEIGWKGFTSAMTAIGWMQATPDGLQVPRFDEHNGQSAKRRAMETQRKREARSSASDPENVRTESGQVSASDADVHADKLRSREEKRREEEYRRDASQAPPTTSPTGSRLPKAWSMPDDWKAWCLTNRPDLDPADVAERFRDFWHGKAGKDGRKADWFATWRNWCRAEKPNLRAVNGGAGDWTGSAL
jgi:hypothetical protein